MSSGNKPLPELMLTQVYIAIWRHWGNGLAPITSQAKTNNDSVDRRIYASPGLNELYEGIIECISSELLP